MPEDLKDGLCHLQTLQDLGERAGTELGNHGDDLILVTCLEIIQIKQEISLARNNNAEIDTHSHHKNTWKVTSLKKAMAREPITVL